MDLGREYEIDKVVLYWEAAAAKEYDIYVSDDKKDWTMVATEKAGEKEDLNMILLLLMQDT